MGPGPLLTAFSVLLFLAILFFGKGVRLYTDWLWFADVGYLGVFVTEIKARLLVGTLGASAFFVWLWGNFRAARRASSRARSAPAGDWADFPQRQMLLKSLDRTLPLWLLGGVFLLGVGLSGWWIDWLRFRAAVPFGLDDPVFGRDVGFYVFRLPFWRKVYGLVPVALAAGAAVAGLAYALQRDVRADEDRVELTRPVEVHLAVLGLLFFAWKAAGYRLDAFDLLHAPGGAVFGATYADLHARLPALRLMTAAAALAGLSFLAPLSSGDRRAWWGPAALAGVWLAVWAGAWAAYPRFLQKFKVVANEIVLETPYIERNIDFTRRAYGLANVTETAFPARGDLTTADLTANAATLKNVRLWDHRPLLATFGQLQEIRTYYKFASVDNDRYDLGGDYRQVMLSVRELDHTRLPSRIWINEHLTYTHGYGLVLGPVNEVTGEGLPQLLVRDIPPVTEPGEARARGAGPEAVPENPLTVDRPEIYFGETANEYVIVNTRSKELDYPAGDQNVYSQYAGKAGVRLGGWLRKAAFALRFGALKILLSRDVTGESRVLYHRQVAERVRRVAPFFLYDRDPYPVLSEGRVRWIIDGYTVTDRYPYSQPVHRSLNYIRNSVKAVVDAYDGSVDFYLADPEDPLARSVRAMFPGLLKPLDAMPPVLRRHLRYPQDLFEVQAAIYSRYHMTDPQVFYNQEDLWTAPNEILEGSEVPMEPYYTIMRLPGGAREEYILMQPFTPRNKSNMIAWMAARSDAPHIGELLVYRFPKERLIYGPMQIGARIDQDSQISQQFTLWGQRGVQVLRGNMLVIPVKESLLYVQPVYLQAERGKIPELRRVIVAYEDRIAMRETLDEALRDIFAGWSAPAPNRVDAAPSAGGAASVDAARRLGREAWAVFESARESVKRGDWTGWGRAMADLEKSLRRLKDAAESR